MSTHSSGNPYADNLPSPWPEQRKLRAWQWRALGEISNFSGDSFLLEACPGAGKTVPGLRVAHDYLTDRRAKRVFVVVPTVELASQWAREGSQVGLRLEPNWSGQGVPRDCHGLAITYQRLAAMPELYRHLCGQLNTVVICDEPHHMGETAAWGRAFGMAFEPAVFRLLLSGTPFRSDNDPIPGVTYNADGKAVPDFTYSYREAVDGGICRKIAFVHCDGPLRWADRGTVVEATFVDDLDERQSRLRHRTAISAATDAGLTQMIRDANKGLEVVRSNGHPNAGGLIVASDIQHAREIASVVEREVRETPVVVHSEDPRSADRIQQFRRSTQRWIVAVNMVSEGVDIPRLRVGVYATTVKTDLFFRQVIGRFVRTTPGMSSDPSVLFLPADPRLRAMASEIEEEMHHQLAAVEDTVEISRESEDSEKQEGAFVPLSAELQPHETVMSGLRFSGPEQAAAIDRLARDLQVTPETILARLGIDNEPVIPAIADETEFERRGRLRKERKRLVAMYHHRTGREYRDIQQEINETVAAGRPIGDHTIAELEAAVRRLTRLLAEPDQGRGEQAA